MTVRRILICEFITGGGLGRAPLPAGLAAEGDLMVQALARDLLALPEVEVVLARDERLPACPLPVSAVSVDPDKPVWEQWSRLMTMVDAVWPIAPETDGTLEYLSRLIRVNNKILLGSRPAIVGITASKTVMASYLVSHGLPVVPAGALETSTIPASTSGWVVKPDDGAGCEDTYYFNDKAALENWSEQQTKTGFILQPYIEGTAASLSLLCRNGQAWVIAVNQQRITIREGVVRCEGLVVNAYPERRAELALLADAMAQALPGLWGYVGVDLVFTEQGPLIIEINPRLTTAYVGLHESLQCNPAAWILELLEDKAFLPAIPAEPKAVTITFTHDY